MSEYPYLEKAVKYYEERFKRRNPIRDERDEYNDLKKALRKAEAFERIYKEFHEVEHDDITFGFFMHDFMNKYESGDSE